MGYLSNLKSNGFLHLIMLYIFFTSGFLTNLIQCLIYITIRPFSKSWYRKLNKYICDQFYAQLVFVAEWWGRLDIKFYMDKNDFDTYLGKEHAFGIMNHTYVVDWLAGMLILDKKGIIGNTKAYAKKTIQLIPALGLCWKLSEWFFLDRNYEKDKDKIESHVQAFTEYTDPIWVALYPEGTRCKPYRLIRSHKYASSKGYTVLKHHLFPRTKGFVTSVKYMRGKMGAIYHSVLAFKPEDKHKATFFSLLRGNTIEAHLYTRRIPFEAVPKDDEGCAQFLRDMFVEKDKLLDSFLNTGDFFKESGVESPAGEPVKFERKFSTIIKTLIWCFIALTPCYYALIQILSCKGGLFFVMSIILLYYLIYIFICHLLSDGTLYSQSSSQIHWETSSVAKHIEKKIKIF